MTQQDRMAPRRNTGPIFQAAHRRILNRAESCSRAIFRMTSPACLSAVPALSTKMLRDHKCFSRILQLRQIYRRPTVVLCLCRPCGTAKTGSVALGERADKLRKGDISEDAATLDLVSGLQLVLQFKFFNYITVDFVFDIRPSLPQCIQTVDFDF